MPNELSAIAQRKAWPASAELTGGRPTAVAARVAAVHSREGDRRCRGGRGHDERADQHVPAALRQQQPGRAGAQVRHGQDAPGEVVRAEERRAPSGPLGRRLARGRDGEEQEAESPEHLLPRAAAPERAQQERREGERHQPRAERQERVQHGGAAACGRELIDVTGEEAGTTRR